MIGHEREVIGENAHTNAGPEPSKLGSCEASRPRGRTGGGRAAHQHSDMDSLTRETCAPREASRLGNLPPNLHSGDENHFLRPLQLYSFMM